MADLKKTAVTHQIKQTKRPDWKRPKNTLQGTNISPENGILKMIFPFPRWDMLVAWRVCLSVYMPRNDSGVSQVQEE